MFSWSVRLKRRLFKSYILDSPHGVFVQKEGYSRVTSLNLPTLDDRLDPLTVTRTVYEFLVAG